MIRMMEFRVEMEKVTPEAANKARVEQSALAIPIKLPQSFSFKRLNGRIVPIEKTGIDPKTKLMGKYLEMEECVYIWVEADEDSALQDYVLHVIPTGFPVPHSSYLATVLLQSGSMPFHFYGPDKVINVGTTEGGSS